MFFLENTWCDATNFLSRTRMCTSLFRHDPDTKWWRETEKCQPMPNPTQAASGKLDLMDFGMMLKHFKAGKKCWWRWWWHCSSHCLPFFLEWPWQGQQRLCEQAYETLLQYLINTQTLICNHICIVNNNSLIPICTDSGDNQMNQGIHSPVPDD